MEYLRWTNKTNNAYRYWESECIALARLHIWNTAWSINKTYITICFNQRSKITAKAFKNFVNYNKKIKIIQLFREKMSLHQFNFLISIFFKKTVSMDYKAGNIFLCVKRLSLQIWNSDFFKKIVNSNYFV